MISVEAVKAGLRVPDVLDRFGIEHRDRRQIRLRECPACRETTRHGAVVIDRESGQWCHHSGLSPKCKGDLLELVAAFAGIDRKRELVRLLEVAAPIAGVSTSTTDAEVEAMIARARREREARERVNAERQAAAHAAVPLLWEQLARRSDRGDRYLAGRGLDPDGLRDHVRFSPDGHPCVRLFDGETPINILRRQIDREPKVLALDDCSTDGTIIGRVGELDRQGPDVAVLAEGMTDSLAAVLAFPGCVVVGANGAGRLPDIAELVAPMLAAINGHLVIVPDVDAAGVEHAADAVIIAERAGLVLDRSILLVDVRPHKDLADAYRAGWRWSWPS